MRAVLSGLSVLLLSSHPALTHSAMTTPAACEALQKLQLDGVALTITRTHGLRRVRPFLVAAPAVRRLPPGICPPTGASTA